MSGSIGACFCVELAAPLTHVDWNLTNWATVLLEYTLPIGKHSDHVCCERARQSMRALEAMGVRINPIWCVSKA